MSDREFLLQGVSDYYNNVVINYKYREVIIKYDNDNPIGEYLHFYTYMNHRKPSDFLTSPYSLYNIKTLSELLKILEYINDK